MDFALPLLSIIIPTRNRPATALSAISSALGCSISRKLEVVVADCSDNDELSDLLVSKRSDPRLRYFKNQPQNMTANWNSAFSRATGEYALCIGDDDAVLPDIMEFASYAKKNSLDALISTKPIKYWWPNYEFEGALGCLRIAPFSSEMWKQQVEDVLRSAINRFRYPTETYIPQPYHNIIKMEKLNITKAIAGEYFLTTAPDGFSANMLSFVIRKVEVIDWPIVISGHSKLSNTGRAARDAITAMKHYTEYSQVARPAFLPKQFLFYQGIKFEELYGALCAMNLEWLFWEKVSLSRLYALALIVSQPKGSRWTTFKVIFSHLRLGLSLLLFPRVCFWMVYEGLYGLFFKWHRSCSKKQVSIIEDVENIEDAIKIISERVLNVRKKPLVLSID